MKEHKFRLRIAYLSLEWTQHFRFLLVLPTTDFVAQNYNDDVTSIYFSQDKHVQVIFKLACTVKPVLTDTSV